MMSNSMHQSAESRILKAAHFAAIKHRDQRRKGKEASPYINHPIAVAQILADTGGVTDTDVIVAALLHDTVGDTDTTPDELVDEFGARIATLVMEVTDDKNLERSERKRLQVEHAKHLSRDAKMIKMADKIANIADIVRVPPEDWSNDRKREYFDWAERVVAGCREAHDGLANRFDEIVAGARGTLS